MNFNITLFQGPENFLFFKKKVISGRMVEELVPLN